MLINITNHPSDKWPDNQILASSNYGTIIDFPFPSINPASESVEVLQIALTMGREIISMIRNGNEDKSAVHIMGEMTFCHALVSLLQKAGITCIASTTDRIVTESGNSKLVEFNFVRFREYPVFNSLPGNA